MKATVADRTQARSTTMPWRSIAIFAAAAAAAALALVLVNQPWQTQTETTSLSAATSTEAVAVPAPEGRIAMRLIEEKVAATRATGVNVHPRNLVPASGIAAAATDVGASEASAVNAHPRNFLPGLALEQPGGYVAQPAAPWYAPGAVDNAHPLNLIAGSSR